MAYPIAGMVREWHPEDYDFGYPISPHGISTAIPASYTFRYLAPSSHERFGEVAEILGIGHREMGSKELSDALFEYYVHLLEDLGIPTKLGGTSVSGVLTCLALWMVRLHSSDSSAYLPRGREKGPGKALWRWCKRVVRGLPGVASSGLHDPM